MRILVLWYVYPIDPCPFLPCSHSFSPYVHGKPIPSLRISRGQLLASALACYAVPWQPSADTYTGEIMGPTAESCLAVSDENENKIAAEAYFQAAKKRIGLLESSILDVQCLFFASVFERYAFRPASAWSYIQLGCTRLQDISVAKRAAKVAVKSPAQ